MKTFKKITALTLAVITLLSAFVMPTFAASSSRVSDQIEDYLPIVTYASPLSGEKIVYAYSDSSLTKKQSSRYINTYTDIIVITDISSSGKAVLVTYPTSNGYREAYFRTDDILGIESIDIREYESQQKLTVYRLSSATKVKSNGSISKGDDCVSLGKHIVNGKNYYVTIYPISRTTVNGVSGIKHKIALSTIAGYNDPYYENTQIVDPNSSKNTWISTSALKSAASKYDIDTDSEAYEALESINTKYASKFSTAEKKGTLIFMFEGVGSDSSSSNRMNAMCVVVQNGKITYINQNSSTIPDYPFDPSHNKGENNEDIPMPTLKSGIYSFTTVNHGNKSPYAALKVSNAKVLRFRNTSDFYDSTSTGINVHRRSTNDIAPQNATWANSSGCILIGKSGTASSSEYAKFIQTIGIVGSSAKGNAKYSTKVTGKIVVDRTYAADYLKSVGYSTSAIKALG